METEEQTKDDQPRNFELVRFQPALSPLVLFFVTYIYRDVLITTFILPRRDPASCGAVGLS